MPKRMPAGYREGGLTLPELLISMVIMTVVLAVVSGLYYTSYQVWRRCSAESQAASPRGHLAGSDHLRAEERLHHRHPDHDGQLHLDHL